MKKTSKSLKSFVTLLLILALSMSIFTPALAASQYEYFPKYTGSSGSIVDALNSLNIDSSYSFRCEIARVNGIANYSGAADQNHAMLKLLKSGELKDPTAPVTTSTATSDITFPRYYGSSCSLVDALRSVGIDSSYSYRCRIAAANGVSGYEGTADQNTKLLNLLKTGNLLVPPGDYTSTETKYTCTNWTDCNTNGTCYEVTKNNAPLRDGMYETCAVLCKLKVGDLLRVQKIVENSKGNKWAKVIFGDGESAWIYTGNIEKHTKHVFTSVINSEEGFVDLCVVCGLAVASDNESAATCDLTCVASQAVLGDFSAYDANFWGIVSRILMGEVPVAGALCDVRDLIYDVMNDAHPVVIGIDVLAILPVVGAIKYASKLDSVKYVDDVNDVIKHVDDIPVWTRWSDYPKVTLSMPNGDSKTYAQIGDFYYTEHAVNEMIPTSTGVNKIYRYTDNPDMLRGISPTYTNWVLTEGIDNGTTIRKSSYIDEDGLFREEFVNGSLTVVVADGNRVVTTYESLDNYEKYLGLYKTYYDLD